MQTFNLIAYNNATFRWTLDVSQLGPFFDAGGKLHMIGALPTGVTYEWIQGAASGGIITVSNVAGVYTARFTAPLADVRNWFGRMRFDCRGELPSGAAEPVMSGTITFEQGRTRAAGDPASTAVDTYFDTVDGGGPALALPVDVQTAIQNAIAATAITSYALFPIMRHEAIKALKNHTTGGQTWYQIVAAALPADESDDTNGKFMNSFWPANGSIWTFVQTALSIDSTQLNALKAEALAYRATP